MIKLIATQLTGSGLDLLAKHVEYFQPCGLCISFFSSTNVFVIIHPSFGDVKTKGKMPKWDVDLPSVSASAFTVLQSVENQEASKYALAGEQRKTVAVIDGKS